LWSWSWTFRLHKKKRIGHCKSWRKETSWEMKNHRLDIKMHLNNGMWRSGQSPDAATGYGPIAGLCDNGDESLNSAVIIWKFSVKWTIINCSRPCQCFMPHYSRSVLTFLCPAIISSRRMARKMVCTLKLGCTKQRAAAVMLAVRGPLIPIVLRYSRMLGVSLNGTGRLASKSPAIHTLEYLSRPTIPVLPTYP
jgi:hypothetical protein